MSHKIIHTFNFTAVEETVVDLRGVYGSRFSMLLGGTMGGTTLSLEGGLALPGPYEPIRVTNPGASSIHNAWDTTFVGMYNFNACVPFLKILTTGGAGIDIDFDLFTVPRPT